VTRFSIILGWTTAVCNVQQQHLPNHSILLFFSHLIATCAASSSSTSNSDALASRMVCRLCVVCYMMIEEALDLPLMAAGGRRLANVVNTHNDAGIIKWAFLKQRIPLTACWASIG